MTSTLKKPIKTKPPTPKKLTNGLHYLIVPTESQTVSVSILIKTGSAYESKKENGIAHFLEHMMFKGTTKRLTAKDIAIDFEKIGAFNNAFTSQTVTGYWAKSQKDHAHTILEILSDIYNNAQFRTPEIEKEKGVVLQEMAMYEDMPQEKVGMMFEELMYPDQPYGRSILGTKETVINLTEKQLRNFYDTHYTRDKTWIVISGGVNPMEMEKDIKKFFVNKTAATNKSLVTKNIGAKKSEKIPEPKTSHKNPKYSFTEKKTDQVHIMLGTPVGGFDHKDRFVYETLATILGRGMSSRLFIKMREELGICYYANAGYGSNTATSGQFTLSAGVDIKRVDVAMRALWHECIALTQEIVDEDELAKAKQMMKSGIAMSTETAEDIANFYATQYMRRGTARTPEEIYKKIDIVTSADVKRLAKEIFVVKNMYIAGIGDGVKKIEGLLG